MRAADVQDQQQAHGLHMRQLESALAVGHHGPFTGNPSRL